MQKKLNNFTRVWAHELIAKTLLEFENAIYDLFERNRITVDSVKTVLWQLLTALYEDELIEEPHRREIIISNIERQKDNLLVNILGEKWSVEAIINIY